MLYDPKWEVEVKADPFSLESLIAWLEKQPSQKTYNWASTKCLGCQYLAARGLPITAYSRFDVDLRIDIFMAGQSTFGAALDRARAALSSKEL